tara:strand:+ start:1122 stop:1331 length:210 start_codon:yes stop_codon:yes gene_type:complete
VAYKEGTRDLITRYSAEVAALISETIEAWDPKATSDALKSRLAKTCSSFESMAQSLEDWSVSLSTPFER